MKAAPVISFPQVKDRLAQIFKGLKVRIGLSLEFQNITAFPLHHRQAKEAAAYGEDAAAEDEIKICDFRKAGAFALSCCFDPEYAYASLQRKPALQICT